MMAAGLEAFEAELDYRFRNPRLLERALTHRSRAHELGSPEVAADNEQLEFLGDSVLGFLVSEWLVHRFSGDPEGRLSKLKAHLVSAAHLYRVAQSIRLGDHLILGRGEELSGGREKKALLADALEAVMAALYLDGGIEPVRRLVVARVLTGLDETIAASEPIADYKSALQECAQTLHLPLPRYEIVEERGPGHSKTFVVEVRVGRVFAARAEGLSKKSAGQHAARAVLSQLTDSKSGA